MQIVTMVGLIQLTQLMVLRVSQAPQVLEVSQGMGALRMERQALGQVLAPAPPVPVLSALIALVAAQLVSWRLLKLMCASMEPTVMR